MLPLHQHALRHAQELNLELSLRRQVTLANASEAGSGTRTHDTLLEGRNSTTELYLHNNPEDE